MENWFAKREETWLLRDLKACQSLSHLRPLTLGARKLPGALLLESVLDIIIPLGLDHQMQWGLKLCRNVGK